MWIYEVTSELPPKLGDAFLEWIPKHASEVLSCPGFLEARLHEVEVETTEVRAFVVRYVLSSREALDTYVATFAPELRADAERTFGEHLRSSRRIMRQVGTLNR